jgi:hypothetical protein
MDMISAKWNRPLSRSWFITPTFFLFFFLIEICRFNIHMRQKLTIESVQNGSGLYLFFLIMALAFFVQWLFSISGRMVALRLSRFWIIGYLVPWAIVLIAMATGTPRQAAASMVLALAVQLPLMLLRSKLAPPSPVG